MCPAAAPAAFSPCASVAPAASAAAFLAAPASSTPIGSLDCSQMTPARVKTCAERARELLVARRGDEPGAVVDHLLRVCRTADARHAPGAERRAENGGGRQAVGRDESLGDDTTAARRPRPPEPSVAITSASPLEGTAEKHVVGPLDARGGGFDAQLRGQLDAGEVDAVLALGIERPRLLGRARLQRRAQPAPREQDGERGAE